jgi:hypothetical protein
MNGAHIFVIVDEDIGMSLDETQHHGFSLISTSPSGVPRSSVRSYTLTIMVISGSTVIEASERKIFFFGSNKVDLRVTNA